MTHWYPEAPQIRGGVVGRAKKVYNEVRNGAWASVLWAGVCVALAATLVLSAVSSAREARSLSDQMERLEHQIKLIQEKNTELERSRSNRG